jgi:hypothetical protein
MSGVRLRLVCVWLFWSRRDLRCGFFRRGERAGLDHRFSGWKYEDDGHGTLMRKRERRRQTEGDVFASGHSIVPQ